MLFYYNKAINPKKVHNVIYNIAINPKKMYLLSSTT